jgi:osmotically-inducible protein OsmY
MYFLDPDRGRRRRHQLLDKIIKAKNRGLTGARQSSRRAVNRIRGLVAELGQLHRSAVPDDVLNNRVRSEFGRKVTHASSIQSQVDGGVVKLSGPVLESECAGLLRCVRRVPGVRGVINLLELHATGDSIPALQGRGKPYIH